MSFSFSCLISYCHYAVRIKLAGKGILISFVIHYFQYIMCSHYKCLNLHIRQFKLWTGFVSKLELLKCLCLKSSDNDLIRIKIDCLFL